MSSYKIASNGQGIETVAKSDPMVLRFTKHENLFCVTWIKCTTGWKTCFIFLCINLVQVSFQLHVFKKLHASYTKNVHLLLFSDLKVITIASKIH
jgi:hypothetical protein